MDIYIDNEYKCYSSNDGTRRKVETTAFDGKCQAYIEGCRFVPSGEVWSRSDGKNFEGEMITTWIDSALLEKIQAQYEAQLAAAAAAYAEGVNSI